MKRFQLSLAVLFALLLSASSPPAHADGLVLNLSDHWACSPVGAITGFQLNLKTSTFERGVALGAGYGCRYDGWKIPLGIDLIGGISMNDNAPNAGQGNVLFTAYDNYGIAFGGQIHKDPTDGSLVPQAIVSFVLTASAAATMEQFKAAKKAAAARATEEAKAANVATPPKPVAVEAVTPGIVVVEHQKAQPAKAEPVELPAVATKSGWLQISGGDAR
jgi:hypothetical protein